MSDLFKDHGSELSDDEDRRLWQRVRAIPGEAKGEAPRGLVSAPWWTRLWVMPAVRYGAPALAVLLVAVVWVVERRPVTPARVADTRAMNELDRTAQAPQSAAPENAPAPLAQAPPAVLDSREKLAKESRTAEGADQPQGQESKDETAGRADGGAVLEREVSLKAAPAPAAPAPEPKEAQTFAAAPPQSARDEVTAKPAAPAPANWGLMKSQSRDSGSRSAPAGATDRLAGGALPTPAELARHALVTEVAGVEAQGPLTATVTAPRGDFGLSAGESIVLGLSPGGAALVRFGRAPGIPYESAPARVQATVLAALLERALEDPAGAPRARLEALKDAALGIDARSGGQGRARLLGALEGALGATPAR